DNWGGFNFSHDFDRAKLSAGFKYTYSAFNYSGLTIIYQPAPTDNGFVNLAYEIKDYPNQANNMMEAHAGIFSDTTGKLNYKLNVKYTGFKQKHLTQIVSGVKENRVIIDWNMHSAYHSTGGFGMSGFYKTYQYRHEEYGNYTLSDDITNYSVLSLSPYYYMEGGNLNLTLGLRADFELGGRKKAVVAPNIRFNYYPSNTFMFYASALGGRNDNSNYSMFYENRYVHPSERIRDSRTWLDGTAGLRYLPVSGLSLDVFAGYRLTEDEHFFTPIYGMMISSSFIDQPVGSLFMGRSYGTAKVARLGAQINYALQDLFGLNLKGTFYKWNIDGTVTDAGGLKTQYAPEAFHKPQFEAETDVFFRAPNIPLRVNLTFKGLYGRKTIVFLENSSLRMKDAHDLSVKANYAVTPFFSVNLSANNLLFRKYDVWYGYPAQEFNIMAGITIMF
ncbi:MAG: TonB-dependent receptor, partial [Dysgonamonadaceae bacterium]|nr:TonB-dependent receptor [Dysgonamonadaceae bacterium]